MNRRIFNGKKPNSDRIFELLVGDHEFSPNVVDVGARNGMLLLPESYCRYATLFSFEPNPVEFEKLKSGNTDAKILNKTAQPKFAKTELFNSAAWSEDTEGKFFITEGPGACTMMGETDALIGKKIFQKYGRNDPRYGKSFYQCHGSVKQVISTKCSKLDSVLPEDITIDFLKIDVEGGELRVLKGADNLLSSRKILLIYTEFVALPYYQEHPVFGDLHTFLRDKGYRLIEIEVGHAGYVRDKSALPLKYDRELLHAGDAFFVLDPDHTDMTAETRQRLAAISFCFGFYGLCLSLLRESKLNSEHEISLIEEYSQKVSVSLGRKLRLAWQAFPLKVARFLQHIRTR